MLPILAAILAFITIGGLGWALVGGDDSSSQALKRAETITGKKSAASSKTTAVANTPEARRKQIMTQLQEAERRERKARMSMSAKLAHAGLSLKVQTFYIICGVLGVVALMFSLLFGMNIVIALGIVAHVECGTHAGDA